MSRHYYPTTKVTYDDKFIECMRDRGIVLEFGESVTCEPDMFSPERWTYQSALAQYTFDGTESYDTGGVPICVLDFDVIDGRRQLSKVVARHAQNPNRVFDALSSMGIEMISEDEHYYGQPQETQTRRGDDNDERCKSDHLEEITVTRDH